MVNKVKIPEGYQQSEIGIIPIDWNVHNIIENSTLKARIGWQGLTTAEYLEVGDYFLITGTDFLNGRIMWETCHYVNRERFIQDLNIQVKTGDILITKDGTIGKVAYINNLPNNATLNSGVFVVRPKGNAYLPIFLFYIFNSFYFNDFLRKLVAGSTINHLYQKDFISFKFPLPYLKEEQTAIATALSDVDALIENLEKLIEKKRNIKQGVMQELLRPKSSWKRQTLGDICKVFGRIGFRGYTTKDIVPENEGAISLSPSNIVNGELNFKKCTFISWEKYEESPEIKLNIGDIVLVKTASIGKTALVKFLPTKTTLNPQIVVLKNITVNNIFLSYLMGFKPVQDQIKEKVVGGVVPTLSQEQISGFKIFVPSLEEQDNLANNLLSIDAEIEAINTKLNKYKMIKKGMMQTLLTGKIRLI